jgi:predicted membrane protein
MKKIVIGVIVVMLGVFLLFNNLGFLPRSVFHLVISWQTLLIAIGAVLLFDKKSGHRHESVGVFLIFVGVIFLITKILCVNWSGILIPMLVIIAGIYFIVIAVTRKETDDSCFNHKHFKHFEKMPFAETSVNSDGDVKRDYVFTGSKEKWCYGKLKNMEINAVFSGVEIDLTRTELSDEVEAVQIHVSSVFSGVVLYVPEEWNIIIQKTGVFGGFSDSRPRNAVRSATRGKVIIMELEAVFGGGEIKSYE